MVAALRNSSQSLTVLKQFVETVYPDLPLRPCDYFDMIDGTSTSESPSLGLQRQNF